MWARFRNNCSACVWWEIWFVISSLNTGLEIIIIFYMQIKWFCTNQVKWMVFWLEFTHDYSLNGNGKSRRTKIDVQIGENDDWCQNSVLLPLMKPIILFCQSNLPKRFILLYDFSSNDICPNEISLRIRRGFFFRSYPVRLFHIPNEKKKKILINKWNEFHTYEIRIRDGNTFPNVKIGMLETFRRNSPRSDSSFFDRRNVNSYVFLFVSPVKTFAWIKTNNRKIGGNTELFSKFSVVSRKIDDWSRKITRPRPELRNMRLLIKVLKGGECEVEVSILFRLYIRSAQNVDFICVHSWFTGARWYDRVEFEKRNHQIDEHSGAATEDTFRWTHIGRWKNAQLIRNHKKWVEIDGGHQRSGTTEGCDVQDFQEILHGRAIGNNGQRIHDWLRKSSRPNEFGRHRTDGNPFHRARPATVWRE